MSKEFVNLTPHSILVINGGEKTTIPSSGIITRLEQSYEELPSIGRIPIVKTAYGKIIFLDSKGNEVPEEKVKELIQGRHVIVSALLAPVANRLVSDYGVLGVFAPDTGRAIRDKEGRPIGVPALIRLA